jgi:hypothetical protein
MGLFGKKSPNYFAVPRKMCTFEEIFKVLKHNKYLKKEL